MDITKSFADPKLETGGVWRDYRDDSRIKIKRLPNKAYTQMLDMLRKERSKGLRAALPTNVDNELICQAMAAHVLVGWEKFTAGGEPLEYSREKAKELLITHIDFRLEVMMAAGDEASFKEEQDDNDEGNS